MYVLYVVGVNGTGTVYSEFQNPNEWSRCTVDFEADINQSILNSTDFLYSTLMLKIR